jgi:S1-C subfamily serine protease
VRLVPVLDPPVSGPTDLPRLVEQVVRAVVTLELTWPNGHAFGAAFALASYDGNVATMVTTAHLLDPDPALVVETATGVRGTARLAGIDRGSDLALLSSDVSPAVALQPRLDVRVGEPVITIGTPY